MLRAFQMCASVRAVLLYTVLLGTLLGACQRRDAVPETLDGLYFADEQGISMDAPKLFLLEQGLFELLEGGELSQRGTFEARDGLLRLKPASAGPGAGLETTYAVVEGRLLLGVLRRVGGERHWWTSATLPAEFLGPRWTNRARFGGFRIDWDMRAGEWHYTSGDQRVVLDGVARFEHPAHGGRFVLPVFRSPVSRDGGADSLTSLEDRRDVVGMSLGVLSSFGLRASPEAPLVWEGERVRLRDAGAGSRKLADRLLESERSRFYERRGDIFVTPWTVDLGPVGLTPVRADPSALAGTYVSGNEELVVSTQPPAPESEGGYRVEGLSFDADEAEPRTCHYAPDARGLVVWKLEGGHLPMSHWDKPFTAVCFALADGGVVRYVSSGGCSGGVFSKLHVFQRR